MPSKKKGKGNKLARMSDEERARYLQHRAELELEARRRKQQLIAIFTKNKLKREEAFSKLNIAKINEQWRFILRRIKCKELHDDVEYWWKNFDRVMKTKDLIIERLHSELEIAGVDHRRLQEAHIQIIDKLIMTHKQRLSRLYDCYSTKLHDVECNDMLALSQLRETLRNNCTLVKSTIHAQEKLLEDRLERTRMHNAVNMYNIVYLKEDTIAQLILQTSKSMENMWKELSRTIVVYKSMTEDKRKQYEYLKEQDDTHQLEFAQYPKLYSQLQSRIENLRNDVHLLSQKRGDSIKEIKTQARKMRNKIWEMRQDCLHMKAMDSSQLKKLSIVSNNIIKTLDKISEKGTALLLLIKMCNNMEPLSLAIEQYFKRELQAEQNTTTVDLSIPFIKLNKFWERYNHIKVENIFMMKERNKLSAENKQLRQRLRTYLITVSRTPTVRPLTSISV